MKMTLIKIFISMTFALIAAMLGVFAVAITKAVVPIFRLTAGTAFEIYVQDPILYFLTPLFCGYITFRKIMRKNISGTVLKSTALGVFAGIVASIGTIWMIPFHNFEGTVRWLLILIQFPITPFLTGYIVYLVARKSWGTKGTFVKK